MDNIINIYSGEYKNCLNEHVKKTKDLVYKILGFLVIKDLNYNKYLKVKNFIRLLLKTIIYLI